MSIPQNPADHVEHLKEVIRQALGADTVIKDDTYTDEFVSVVVPFEGSLEGLTVAIDNAEQLGYETLDGSGYFYLINPWVYPGMKDLKKMEQAVEKLLKRLPTATLMFDDDGSWDFNPNSNLNPASMYVGKSADKHAWRNYFIVEEN